MNKVKCPHTKNGKILEVNVNNRSYNEGNVKYEKQ